MRIKLLLLLFSVCLATSAAALPEWEIFRTYYDSNGNQVGTGRLRCDGSHGTYGTATDSYTEYYLQCVEEAQLFTCEDEGLETVGTCDGQNGNPTFCVSHSYKMSYDACLVPDCQGYYGCSPLAANGDDDSLSQ